MKHGCLIYLIFTFGIYFYYAFWVDPSGYYKVINKNGAMVCSSQYISDADSIKTIPFDTIIKIEAINKFPESAEMLMNGQKTYVKCSDIELVERYNSMMSILKYLVYGILIIIGIREGYGYLKEKQMKLLVLLKALGYVILSAAIAGLLIYNMKRPYVAETLHSRGTSKISKQYTIDECIIPANTQVDVLCYVKHRYLVRDMEGHQFEIPVNGLQAQIKYLKELNESFTHNVSKKLTDSYIGQSIRAFEKGIGSYIKGINNAYEYPYLIAIENGERIKGLKVVTDNDGIIKEIVYSKKKSENIFCKLPFYETIACKNLYVSASMTGDNNLWDKLLTLVGNIAMLGFVIFIFARTASIAYLWSDRNSTSVGKWGNICIWIILSPILYILVLAVLDYYHSTWVLIAGYLISLGIMIYNNAIHKAAKSIYKCPACKMNGVYNPQEVILHQAIVGTIHYNWNYAQSKNGIKIPQKNCTKEISYKMVGKCEHCGYNDNRIYSREVQISATTNCPNCESKLKIFVEDDMYHEECPKCDYSLVVKRFQGNSSASNNNRVRKERPNNARDKADDTNGNAENREYWLREAKEYRKKANEYYDKYIEAVKNFNEQKQAGNDSLAEFYMEQAQKYYDEYEYNKSEADLSSRNAL